MNKDSFPRRGVIENRGQSNPALGLFCDSAKEQGLPRRKGLSQEMLLDLDYRLRPAPDHAGDARSLAASVRDGCAVIILKRVALLRPQPSNKATSA